MGYYLTIHRKDGSEERVPVIRDLEDNPVVWRVVGTPPTLTVGDVMWVPPFWEPELGHDE